MRKQASPRILSQLCVPLYLSMRARTTSVHSDTFLNRTRNAYSHFLWLVVRLKSTAFVVLRFSLLTIEHIAQTIQFTISGEPAVKISAQIIIISLVTTHVGNLL